MSEIKLDIPDILVVLDKGDQYNVTLTNASANVIETTNTFFTVADFATLASSSITSTTASYALTSAGTIVNAVSSSYSQTALLAQTIIGGTSRYIPLWTGSSGNELTSSIIYQTPKGIFVGYDTVPHVHSAEGETLAVHSGETGVKNVIYAHGTFNDDYRINIRNISSGVSASTNYKATSDVGNDEGGYVQMGINSSTYTRTDQIGGALDAYLYTTGSDLLIGTLSPDKRIVLFTGPGDADNNARVFIDASGSVGINTSAPTAGNPEALVVDAITNSYNLITARAIVDNYAQINIKNLSGGNSASADLVATANNGTEVSNYIDMGINSDQYNQPGAVGGPNDAYLYSTGNQLHIGNASENKHVMFFAGGYDSEANAKLILEANNQHILSGSLNVTGSLNVLEGVVNNLTASFALTASYVAGAASNWDTLLNKPINLVSSSQQVKNFLPVGVVSSSLQATSWTVLSASFATSASWAPTILPSGIISSSTQVDYNQIQNTPAISATASYVEYTNVANKPTLVSSSIQINTGSFSGSFTGQLIGTGSWASNAISSSFATTASAATSITFTPTTASFAISSSRSVTASFSVTASSALTASYAVNADLLDGLTSTAFATTASNTFVGNQTITGSLLTNADTIIFTGSMFVSGNLSVVGGTITGSLFGTASRATTSSYALTASFIDGGFY